MTPRKPVTWILPPTDGGVRLPTLSRTEDRDPPPIVPLTHDH
jgi:hypothetical protein